MRFWDVDGNQKLYTCIFTFNLHSETTTFTLLNIFLSVKDNSKIWNKNTVLAHKMFCFCFFVVVAFFSVAVRVSNMRMFKLLRDGPLEKWWGGRGKNQKKIHAREIAKKKNSCKEEGKEKKFIQKEGPGPGPVAMAWRHLSVRLLSSQEFCGSIVVCNNCFQ